MRIGIDAHIILPKHKRYDPKIARYTEQLISHLIEADKKNEHTWVLFFDERMKNTKKYQNANVEIKHFPFVQYRRYLPVFYSHMLISAFLRSAKLDLFHSPEGLIPSVYPGKIVTTFHYVPRGKTESNLFVRTFMFGPRVAFAQLCKRAQRIIVNTRNDKKLLEELHGYSPNHIVIMENDDIERVDWSGRIKKLLKVYGEVAVEPKKEAKKKKKTTKAKTSRQSNSQSKKPGLRARAKSRKAARRQSKKKNRSKKKKK